MEKILKKASELGHLLKESDIVKRYRDLAEKPRRLGPNAVAWGQCCTRIRCTPPLLTNPRTAGYLLAGPFPCRIACRGPSAVCNSSETGVCFSSLPVGLVKS